MVKRCSPLLIKLLFGILVSTVLISQNSSTLSSQFKVTSTPLNVGDKHFFESEVLNKIKEINVILPDKYHQRTQAYPIIVVMDGEFMLKTVSGVVHHWSSVSWMPEAIVIGVTTAQVSPKSISKSKKKINRLELLNTFYRDELIPFIESRYRTEPFRMIIGLHPTATPILVSSLMEPELFQANIAIVAGHLLKIKKNRLPLLNSDQNLLDAVALSFINDPDSSNFLYISSTSGNLKRSPHIPNHFKQLEKRLKPFLSNSKGFKSDIFPGNAYAIAQPSIISAFEMIFPRKLWDPDYSSWIKDESDVLLELDNFFKNLSATYGFKISPIENRLRNINSLSGLARLLIIRKEYKVAIRVAKKTIEYYPNSVEGHYHLAAAFQADKQLRNGLVAVKKAINNAKNFSNYELFDKSKSLEVELKEALIRK